MSGDGKEVAGMKLPNTGGLGGVFSPGPSKSHSWSMRTCKVLRKPFCQLAKFLREILENGACAAYLEYS